jgi:ABC-type multidrug transport system permease subunit
MAIGGLQQADRAWSFYCYRQQLWLQPLFYSPLSQFGRPEVSLLYFLVFGFAITNLILIATAISPKAKWRWGKKPSDNPDEDF